VKERRVRVGLGARSYAIAIAPRIVDNVGERLRLLIESRTRALVVSNTTVWPLYGARVRAGLESAGFDVVVHLVDDGERFKRLAEVERAIGAAVSGDLERGDPVIAVGGGVVGDLAGLVAALFMRGTPVVHVPTTLLAQIDSSVGGKVAVNHSMGKNLIGVFHQPVAVYSDPDTLLTLPGRELRAGLFESVKYGVLADADLFSWIGENLEVLRRAESTSVARLAERCCRIKARIVAADEREAGIRRYLNRGHTAGHALETVTRYRRFRHGEAVGYGIEVAAELSRISGRLTVAETLAIRELVGRVGRRPAISDLDPRDLVAAMRHDKKRSAGRIGFVLPVAIGSVVFEPAVAERDIMRALRAVARGTVV